MKPPVTEKVLEGSGKNPKLVWGDDVRFPTLETLDWRQDDEALAFYGRCFDRLDAIHRDGR